MKWKLLTFIFLGAFLGTATGVMHPLEWNRPLHYTQIATTFCIFPIIFLILAISEKQKKQVVTLIIAAMIPYLLTWEIFHWVMHKRFFDDMLFMWLLEVVTFVGLGAFVNHLKNKLFPETVQEQSGS